MSTEFHIFKNNTDAPATNKGFYFQYLLTLKNWIANYDKPESSIFCEYEDDILVVDTKNNSRHYTQVKCYSSGFALSSDEIVESLINFYRLYLSYKNNYNGTYLFCTTSGFKPRVGETLRIWHEQQTQGDYTIDNFVLPTRTAIITYLHKLSARYKAKSPDSATIAHVDKKIEDFKENINRKDFEDFLLKIRWDFKQYSEDNFNLLMLEIKKDLLRVKYNSAIGDQVFIGYLLHQVIAHSSFLDANDRKLDNALFEKLIIDTQDQNKVHQILHQEFAQLFSLLPRIDLTMMKVNQNTEKLIEKLNGQISQAMNPLEIFYEDLKNWFTAIDYKFGAVDVKKADNFLLEIQIQDRRKLIPILVYGIVRPIQVPDIETLKVLKTQYDCEEAWIVSTGHATPAARLKLDGGNASDIFCYNFDELLEETMNFSKYFDWVEQEIKEKKIAERFIPVAVKKGEFNPVTKEVMATSIYGKREGWLEGYINSWLADEQKEHVSILGEFGTGKTWFTLYYTWKQIEAYRQAKINRRPRPRIPILIFLRDFAKAMQVDVLISDFFFRKHKIDMKGVFNAFNQLNKMGKLLLIFDGFDEMADRIDKQKMIDNFWQLASVVKGQSKAILTCRNEHFATIKEGRNLLNAEFKNSTNENTTESPKFEVVELLKFDSGQIKQMLSYFTSQTTIDLIFRNRNIVDLLSRPVMVELVLDAIIEIENEQQLDLAKVYFYATRRKMERDIVQRRTFTSLADKIFFMCELAWEMLSTNKLTINYKEFPDIIYQHFNKSVDQKDLDYWRYDLRGQSMLIIDDEGGNYKPAHKSMLEFFVAYKFASDLGILKNEYLVSDASNKNHFETDETKSFINVQASLNTFPFHSRELHLVHNFFISLIKEDKQHLWRLFDIGLTNKQTNNIFLNNILTILINQENNFSNRDFSNLELHDIVFKDADLSGSNFSNVKIHGGGFVNSDLTNCNFQNMQMIYQGRFPALRDVSGNNLCDFTINDDIVRVSRFGITIIKNDTSDSKIFIPLENNRSQISVLEILKNNNLVCIADYKDLIVINLLNHIQTKIKAHNAAINDIVSDHDGERFATLTDSITNTGELKIWNTKTLTSETIKLKNSGLFCCCFTHLNNRLLTGGRDGNINIIDLSNGALVQTITFQNIGQGIANTGESNRHQSKYIYSLSLSSDDRLIAIGSTYRSIIVWDQLTSTVAFNLDLGDAYSTQLIFSPNDEYLAYHAIGKGFAILETKNWTEIYKNEVYCDSIKFSKNSKYLIFSDSDPNTNIFLLRLQTMTIIQTYAENLDFSGLNIENLLGPTETIKYFLQRGAQNWYSKEELLNLPQDALNILSHYNADIEDQDKEKFVERVWSYIINN